ASTADYYPGGMMMPGRNTEYSWSRFGAQKSPKDDEVYGKGNLIDMGDRHLDTRILRTPKPDKEAVKYPGISPYTYVNNSFTNAIDPDGRLIVFVNGYRLAAPIANVYREIVRSDRVTHVDKLGYWGNIDDKFAKRIGDYNTVYADGDAPTFTKGNQAGFDARVAHGREAGKDIISRINSGDIVLAKNDAGEVIESIKVVAHSMGYAYAIGMSKVLQEAGYKIEVAYNLAPENDRAGQYPPSVGRVVQFGENPKSSIMSSDWVAPQSSDGIPSAERAFIPSDAPHGPAESHYVDNYSWIFDRAQNLRAGVRPSNNNAPRTPVIDKNSSFTPPSTNVNAKDN
ncbi:MAG: hypothetical protein QM530_05115, partial [Phycisphaerales bacterium]|nr:hypothetical protein [Phycisphaerales bacterium]